MRQWWSSPFTYKDWCNLGCSSFLFYLLISLNIKLYRVCKNKEALDEEDKIIQNQEQIKINQKDSNN
ncbi:hypothetical protein [Candidatus Phytoplasma solani]|uniref:hypothetical protein n=1 Tax=Candidatus Phytoplasma solani TaxID=69896 RepID=UPI0003B7D0FA|nr:hypothetical protein S284_02240 [Candidatus Phytoplasma solani]